MSCLLHIYLSIRFKILLAAFCTSILCFHDGILSLYDFCMTSVHYFMPYICRKISKQHVLDTFTTLTVLD